MSQGETYGVITSYRRGPKTQRPRELILLIPGVRSRREASKFIGRRVECRLPGKVLRGKIVRPHGRTGKVLVRFKRGPPGQILGSKVLILE
ncbi:50S ribosomal protein L35ae [Candidatus Bathyarchaeota archaeon]|nr:50S ribosomal protein L35ae [Candidatus Bathyarchaeota archaeon]RJS90530.1 MAG: 50S ribosomal protein L35ae [Candidatus Bathyarchaeota archaeon]RLI33221.1 MAG: 50S ribosomal protein L35ae [Candidatus Bathyarchaeota archaeon]